MRNETEIVGSYTVYLPEGDYSFEQLTSLIEQMKPYIDAVKAKAKELGHDKQ